MALPARLLLAGALLALVPGPAAGAPVDARARLSDKSVSAEDLRADVQAEIRFGREVAARILARHPLTEDSDLLRYVNLVGRAVAERGGRPELTYRFGVLETDQVNAFAAPGGYVFVTRGALARMANEAELAGVLAHEIVHVNRKHIVDELGIRAEEGSAVAGFARFLGGAGEATRQAFSQTVERAVDILFEAGRKRADELEADRLGATLLAVAGYRPTALADYLERVADAPSAATEDRRRTHPGFGDRLAELEKVVAEEGLAEQGGKLKQERFARHLTSPP